MSVMLRAVAFVALFAALILVIGAGTSGAQDRDFEEYATGPELTESHADVFRLYWAYFDRTPDLAGAAYWVSQHDRCASLLDIAWSFSNSAEFKRRYGALTHERFVELVYANVLDRPGDLEGKRYWLGLLATGELEPAEVMLYFSLGTEFKGRHPLPSDGRDRTTCTQVAENGACDPNYSDCVPIAGDVDCEGGSGDGPAYEKGPVEVIGIDIYQLDADNDGVACEQ